MATFIEWQELRTPLTELKPFNLQESGMSSRQRGQLEWLDVVAATWGSHEAAVVDLWVHLASDAGQRG
jgi:hypothetical protein